MLTWAFCSVHGIVSGQTIAGQIKEREENKPIENVIISNIYTEVVIRSDKEGKFSINASAGELVEFRKEGYQVMRMRVPQGKLPYFKVSLKRYDPSVPMFDNPASPDYKSDSIKYAALYKKELEFPQLTGYQAIQHPFSAMSKRNQQIWAFQKEYNWYQQQKYIDYVFNDKLITSITGIVGDSLQLYKQLFRPGFEQLRSMGEYNYLLYIKRTVQAYRKKGIRARMSPSRSSN